MTRYLFVLSFLLFIIFNGSAQSYAFGVKSGATFAFQKWDGIDQQVLTKTHGVLFIESAPEENKFAFFAQVGYHPRGSAIRYRSFFNPNVSNQTKEFLFHNAALLFGAKQKFELGLNDSRYYYGFGFRFEYTFDNNLDDFDDLNSAYPGYYPTPYFVKKFNYGATVNGGLEFPFSEFIGGILEFSISPDFSNQYEGIAINTNTTNPYTGQQITIPKRVIRNLSFEISLGIRFLRKIEYID